MTAAEDDRSQRSDCGSSDDVKARIADRFAEADLETDRFINVTDGEKGTHDHDTRCSDPRNVRGQNYGIYPGDGLVYLDVDDYGDSIADKGLAAIRDLPETLTTESPHTDGDPGGHRFYRVTGDAVDALEAAFKTANPQPSWGEVRAHNQYVVGPGSELDSCDKDWHDCSEPGEGHYTIASDESIATITAEELIDALRTDPDLAGDDGRRDTKNADASHGMNADASGYDPAGTPSDDVIAEETKLARYLAAGAKAAGFKANDGTDDRSDADYYAVCLAIEYGVPEADIRERLAGCEHSKVNAPDAARDYWQGTWSEALADVDDPNSKALGTDATASPKPPGFDVHNGGYAKWVPTDDGEGYYDEITNFQIETVSRLTTDGGDREFHLRVHPAAEGEDQYEVTCDPVVFNDIRKFRRELLDGWTVTFDGSQEDLNRLKEFVGRQEAKQRRGTKLLGLHGDEWVTPDGALTTDGWTDDPDTVFTDVDTPLANAFSLTPADGNKYDETVIRNILRLLPQTRTPERFIPVLGWFYAAPFRPYIQEWEGEFNLLNILGDTGSGKTTTLELLWRLFGVDEELPEAKATPFSIMRMIASSNALPVILDEYKPAEIRDYKLDELHTNLRTSTRGGVVTKGRSDMGVDTYHLNAPLCVSGEQPIQGPAEERRTILTVFKRDVTVGETPEQRAYARLVGGEAASEWFDGFPLEQHALAYYRWVLRQDKAELHDLWQDCRSAVIDLLEDHGHTGLDDMVIQGFQTIKFGCALYRDFASTMGLDPETTPVTADNIGAAIAYVASGGTGADHVSHLDRLLAIATRAARAGYLVDGDHFKIVHPGEPNAELRVHLPTAFDKIRKYAREHDVRGDDLLGSAQDYKARIKDAADDPEHYVTTHSQKTPPLNRCVGIHMGDAADVVDGFEPEAFGLDRHAGDADREAEQDSRFDTTPLLDVANDPTGYPTVKGELATVEFPENDDAPAVTATLTDGNAAIDLIAWDEDPGLASRTGERVIIENAAITEFDGQTQLVYKTGVTTIHEAPDDDQAQLGASA